jgi:CO/xanthine dehydrogenase FAD-binding subunit
VKPSLFGYARAESVEDALSLLAQGDAETRVLAGGQSLVPLLNLRMAVPIQKPKPGRIDDGARRG